MKEQTARSEQKIEDVDLISSRLKKKFSKLTENEEDLEETVAEAFNRGLSYYLTTEEQIPLTDEKLVDDSFKYERWQLNLYNHIEENGDYKWVDVKNAFLEKGLESLEPLD